MIIDILEVILTDANCNYYRKPFGLTESDLAVICVTWLWYMIPDASLISNESCSSLYWAYESRDFFCADAWFYRP
jgi:hypothetical protein